MLGRPNDLGNKARALEPFLAGIRLRFSIDSLCDLGCIASLPGPQRLHL